MIWYYIKVLELINGFSKVAGSKTNIHKFVALLYTNNGVLEREIMKTVPFHNCTKKNEILRNTSNQGEDL